MKKTVGVGKSHSKIILMGEHAVVYGYPALAIPLHQLEVTCQMTYMDMDVLWSMEYLEGVVSEAIRSACAYLGTYDWLNLVAEVRSSIPEQCGMGSSAAVAIAVIRAVFDYYDRELTADVLEDLVNQAEKVAHGNPSGLDAKTCLSDEPIVFRKEVGFETLPVELGAYLVIADTGLKGQTSQAVAQVASLGQEGQVLLSQLGDLSEAFIAGLAQVDLSALGGLMIQAHALLRQLGVSCLEADHLVAVAQEAGACGAKMSGGGLGGCVIALTDTEVAAQAISQKLREEGAVNTWIERL